MQRHANVLLVSAKIYPGKKRGSGLPESGCLPQGFWDTHFSEMNVWPKSRWANSCVDKIWLEGPNEIPTSVPNINYIRAGLKQH